MTCPPGHSRSGPGPAVHSDRCGDRCGHGDVPAGGQPVRGYRKNNAVCRGGPVRAAIQAQDKDPCMADEILLRQSDIRKRNRLRSWLALRRAGHHTTARKRPSQRSSRLSPKRMFYGAGDPTGGIFPASPPPKKKPCAGARGQSAGMLQGEISCSLWCPHRCCISGRCRCAPE